VLKDATHIVLTGGREIWLAQNGNFAASVPGDPMGETRINFKTIAEAYEWLKEQKV